jgi:hypothetical protein
VYYRFQDDVFNTFCEKIPALRQAHPSSPSASVSTRSGYSPVTVAKTTKDPSNNLELKLLFLVAHVDMAQNNSVKCTGTVATSEETPYKFPPSQAA